MELHRDEMYEVMLVDMLLASDVTDEKGDKVNISKGQRVMLQLRPLIFQLSLMPGLNMTCKEQFLLNYARNATTKNVCIWLSTMHIMKS